MLLKNWGNFVLLQIGASVIKNWGSFILLQIGAAFLLQIGASVITNWGSLIITNQGKFYYKSGQLLQIRTTVIASWGKLYYKFGQLLQIGAIITNWGIIHVASCNIGKYVPRFSYFAIISLA